MRDGQSYGEMEHDLRKDIRRQNIAAEHLRQDEINGKESWDIYDSSRGYAMDFSQVIPSREAEPPYIPLFPEQRESYEQLNQRVGDFRHYLVDEILRDRIGEAIGIDFGGPGQNFFADYQGVFKRSLGVLLYDFNPRPGPPNHSIIEGDMLASKTHIEVNHWLDGEQVDFIMERVAGDNRGLSSSLDLAVHTLSWWYSILREGGVMFFQLPIFRRISIEQQKNLIRDWEKYLNENYSGQIQFFVKTNLARLNKLPGAPERLPLLPNIDNLTQ